MAILGEYGKVYSGSVSVQPQEAACLQEQLNSLTGVLATALLALDAIDGVEPPPPPAEASGSMYSVSVSAGVAVQQAHLLLDRLHGLARRIGRL